MRELVRACTAAIAATVLLPASAWAAGAGPWHAEPALYGVSAAVQHMVTMSDGVQLAADVYRPTGKNGAPAARRVPGDPLADAVRQALAGHDPVDGLWLRRRRLLSLPGPAWVHRRGRRRARHRLLRQATSRCSARARCRTASSWPAGRRGFPAPTAGSGWPVPRTSGSTRSSPPRWPAPLAGQGDHPVDHRQRPLPRSGLRQAGSRTSSSRSCGRDCAPR